MLGLIGWDCNKLKYKVWNDKSTYLSSVSNNGNNAVGINLNLNLDLNLNFVLLVINDQVYYTSNYVNQVLLIVSHVDLYHIDIQSVKCNKGFKCNRICKKYINNW